MGYYTQVRGEIAITPPIPWGEAKGSVFATLTPGGWFAKDVKLRIVEQSVDTDEGTLTRREAVAVVPATEESAKFYSIVEHLQELINLHGESRTFIGRLEGEGEEAGDLWRLEVRDGRAVQIRPRIVWPDGSEESQR